MNHWKIIPLLFLCLLGSCSGSKQVQISSNGQKAADKSISKARLIFVNFMIKKDSLQEHSSVYLTKIQITDGKMKKENLPGMYKPSFQNSIKCIFTDSNDQQLYETTVEHPLFKSFEYAMNDGSIGLKKVVLKEVAFFIRTDYAPEMKYVHVFEKISSSAEIKIAKLELKQ